MSSNFSTLNLTDDRVLIKGTDSQGVEGQTVVWATEWNDVKAYSQVAEATDEFNTAVEKFFNPIFDAVEKLEKAKEGPSKDPVTFVVLDEGEEHVQGREPQVVQLSHDSIVLRLIEEGHGDRLVWVGDSLEILEAPVKPRPTNGRRKKATA